MGELWRGLFWAWVVSEVLVAALTWTGKGRGSRDDRGSMLVLWVAISGAISVASWRAGVDGPSMPHGVRVAAVLVMVAGLAVRWGAIVSLGRAFSVNVAIHAGQRLHRTGLFGVVRHPSYTGMMLVFVALGLRMQSWGALGIVVLVPLAALLYRLRVEEAALGRAFGAEYVEYCRTTKRLVPGVY